MKLNPLLLLVMTAFAGVATPSRADSLVSFRYQGSLNDGAGPATGSYDLSFTLYAAGSSGTGIGSLTNVATVVSNGLFTATLTFPTAFDGTNYWLEIAARTNGNDPFTTLSPRQQLLPTPQAIYAINAGNAATATTAASAHSVAGASITGTLSDARLSANVALLNAANTFAANQVFNGSVTATGFLGDLSGGTNIPLTSLQSGGAASAQILTWDGSRWTPSNAPAGGGLAVTATNLSSAISQSLWVAAGNGTGSGGNLTLNAGNAGIPSGGAGGNLNLLAGNAMPSGGSGYGGLGAAGVIHILAGNGYNNVGGNVLLQSGGNSPWTLTPNSFSKVSMQGGTINAGDGAAIDVEGGHNTQYGSPPQYSAGGNVKITAGTATGAFSGGNIILLPGSGTPSGNVGIGKTSPATALDVNGTVTATAFSGNGAGLMDLTTTNLTGTIADARLSANVALLNGNANFRGAVTASSFTGSGAGVSNVPIGTINSGGALTAGTFVLASSPNVGPGVNFVTAADVNGDGKIDMVVVNGGGASFGAVTVLTNNGSGGFVLAASVNVAVGYYPTAVAAADVNGDGRMDLISGNNDAGTLTVLTNNGSGGWVSAATLGVGAHAASVAAADVNGDGKVDLISANFNDSTLTVLTNNGSGAFAISSSPGVGSHPEKVAAADVNGDGKVDLISENHVAGTLTVLTNDGSGKFVLTSTLTVGTYPQSLAAADVNGDGKVDLISASPPDNTLTVLTNNGSGGFALAAILAVGPHPLGVAAADVNGDGRVDLISANYDDSTLTVLLNNGSGGFVLASTLNVGAGPQSLVAADVNGDGQPDLLSANASANTVSVLLNAVTFNGSFTGNGANATNLNASNFGSGTLADARLSANVALLNSANTFSGNQTVSGTVTANGFSGDLSGGTNLPLTGLQSGGAGNAQVLTWNGMRWVPSNAPSGGGSGGGLATSGGSGTNENLYGTTAFNGPMTATNLSAATSQSLWVAAGKGTGNGGHLSLNAGDAGVTSGGAGGNLNLQSGSALPQGGVGYSGQGPAGVVNISAGGGYNGVGGNVIVKSGPNSPWSLTPNGYSKVSLQGGTLNAGDAASIDVEGGHNPLSNGSSVSAGGSVKITAGNAAGAYSGGHILLMPGTGSPGGNVGIGKTSPATALDVNGTVTATAFSPSSDRSLKENLAPVSPRDVLEKVAAMPISRWNFIGDPATPHFGPMAQDFHAAFGLGTDERHIATVDADGVALAAIQGLNQKLNEKEAEIQDLKRSLADLKELVRTLGERK